MKRLPTIDILMKEAARECTAAHFAEIRPEHLLLAILKFSELDPGFADDQIENDYLLGFLHEELLEVKQILRHCSVDSTLMRRSIRERMAKGSSHFQGGMIHRSSETKALFRAASAQAQEQSSTFLNAAHLLSAILEDPTTIIAEILPRPKTGWSAETEHGQAHITGKSAEDRHCEIRSIDLTELANMAIGLTKGLRARVYGQGPAICDFVEGLFNAEVLAVEDGKRNGTKSLFVFAGPPRTGKTFLAECAAEILGKPFKHFAMASLSGDDAADMLSGTPSRQGKGSPGLLTGFVNENPDAFLVFSEIEGAHPAAIHLILKAIDDGRVEDRFLRRTVDFKKTVLILHTNVGKSLYTELHSRALLLADRDLRRKVVRAFFERSTESGARDRSVEGKLAARTEKGFPVLFGPLGLRERVRIAQAQLDHVASIMETQYEKKLQHHPDLALFLVLRAGKEADPGTIESRVAEFIKGEIFNLSRLCSQDRLEQIFSMTGRIAFDMDSGQSLPHDVKALLFPQAKPKVLLVTYNLGLSKLWSSEIPEVQWLITDNPREMGTIAGNASMDMVLVDLVPRGIDRPHCQEFMNRTISPFDHGLSAGQGMEQFKEAIENILSARRDIPCFLVGWQDRLTGKSSIDEQLATYCMQWGAIRGTIETDFNSPLQDNREDSRLHLVRTIQGLARIIHIGKLLDDPLYPNEQLLFDTAPKVSGSAKAILIRLRNFRMAPRIVREHKPASCPESEPTSVCTETLGPVEPPMETLELIREDQHAVSVADAVHLVNSATITEPASVERETTAEPARGECAPGQDEQVPVQSQESEDQKIQAAPENPRESPEQTDQEKPASKGAEPFDFQWD